MKSLVIMICLSLVAASFARAEDKVLNGGDPVGLEFHQAFHDAVKRAGERAPELAAEIESAGLVAVLAEAKVIVVDTVLSVAHAGATQDSAAANDRAARTIYVQRKRWGDIDDSFLREALALHEVAGLAGLEATGDYSLSGKYLRAIGRAETDVTSAVMRVATAHSKYSRSAKLQAVKCSVLDKAYIAEHQKEYALLGFEEGGQFSWEQGGTKFSLDFMDTEQDMLRNSLRITQRTKVVLERNDRNREISIEGAYRQFSFNESKIGDLKGTYARTIDWQTEFEGVAAYVTDGVADPRPIKLFDKEISPGQFVNTTSFEPNTSAGTGKREVRYLSAMSSCTYELTPVDKIAEHLEPKMVQVVEWMDKKIQGVDLARDALDLCAPTGAGCEVQKELLAAAEKARDELWQNLVPTKEFDMRIRKVRKVVRKPSAPVQKRRAAERSNWRDGQGYDAETSRRLDELMRRGREERELEEKVRDEVRRQHEQYRPWPGTPYRGHGGNPAYQTPWGFRDHRGVPMHPGQVGMPGWPG